MSERPLPKTISLTAYGEGMTFTFSPKDETIYHGKTATSNESLWRVEKIPANEVFYGTEFGWGVFLDIETFETVCYDKTLWGGQMVNELNSTY